MEEKAYEMTVMWTVAITENLYDKSSQTIG